MPWWVWLLIGWCLASVVCTFVWGLLVDGMREQARRAAASSRRRNGCRRG